MTMEISNVKTLVNAKWRCKFPKETFCVIKVTMEISNAQTLDDTRRPRKFLNSNMELIQNDFGNFQGQN